MANKGKAPSRRASKSPRGKIQKRKPGLRGLRYGEKQFYKGIGNKIGTKKIKFARPNIGFDISKGGTAFFDITVGSDEYIRFLPKPIYCRFHVKSKNPNVVAGAADKTGAEYWFLTPANDPKHVGINPSHGISSFFTHANVYLDGHEITSHLQSGQHTFVYNAVNTIFSTLANRKRDDTEDFIQTGEDTADTAAPYKKSRVGLYTSSEIDASHYTVRNCSLDGYPFLSTPYNNALANLEGVDSKDNCQAYLPPGTNISIHLHFRSDLGETLEFADETDDIYFTSDAPGAGTSKFKKLYVTPKDLYLAYESYTPAASSKLHEKFRRGASVKYHMDYPVISTSLIASVRLCLCNTATNSTRRPSSGTSWPWPKKTPSGS